MRKTIKINKKNKIKSSYFGFTVISTIVLSIFCFGIFFLLGWAFLSSFKVGFFAFTDNLFGLPEINSNMFDNYINVFKNFKITITTVSPTRDVKFFEMLFNSLAIAIGCSLSTIIAHAVMAYTCAKYSCKWTKFLYAFVIFTMIMPQLNTLAPMLLIVRGLRIYDTYIGMIIMKFTYLGMYFLILYATFKGIAWDYAEAAFMDGADNFTVFFRIMLPQASATLGVLFILQFIGYWNAYEFNLVYLPSMPTIAYGLYRFSVDASNTVTIPQRFAASILLAIPMIGLFLAAKDKIMGSISVGGLKG